VGGGATSTGAFATFLGSIFGSNDARFTYHGTSDQQAEFGFAVPADNSRYTVGDRQHHTLVPYDGTFIVDTKTQSLLRFTLASFSLS
jgi:hypothetical protein